MREFLKSLELDKETIETIMYEHGKIITEAKGKTQELENKVKEYEAKIKELNSSNEDNEKIKNELEQLKGEIADRSLNDKIIEAIGEKKFINDFTKKAVIDEIKKGLNDESNKGKSINDILTQFTEGKEGIFVEDTGVSRATGIQHKVQTQPEESGVSAILRAKHPELFK